MKLGKGTVRRATKRALLVQLVDYNKQLWIPLSVIHDDSEVYDDKEHATGEVVVKAWWAKQGGLG